jgi:hypothetical protein
MATNKRDRLTSLWTRDPRVAPWSGTAYGVLQAFNTYDHHFSSVRSGVHRAQRNMSDVLTGKQEDRDGLVMTALATVLS